MKPINESKNKHKWPRHRVKKLECRKRDLVLRITDWLDDKDEPAFDVECYVGGVFDWNLSQTFTLHSLKTPELAKSSAIQFAQAQIAKLL